jgi:hypothetical protein
MALSARYRDDAQTKLPRKLAVDFSKLLPERIFTCQDTLCPSKNPSALGRQSSKTPAVTIDERNFQLMFKLPDRLGERRLGDIARLRGASVMALAREGDKKSQVPNVHLNRSWGCLQIN